MSISDQITRLNNAKAAIKESIENKGVSVSSTAKLDEYAALINNIETGSGSGGNPYYEDLFNDRTNNGLNFAYLLCYSSATSLDVSSLDTSKATNMQHMFYYCNKLTSLDVSNFNTSKVKNMSYMFGFCNILTLLEGLNNFNTSNITDMSYMFYSCNNLATLDLSSFDTSNVTNMANMFYYCNNLTSIDVSSFDTSNVTNISYIFQNCNKLASLDLSNWDISKVTASYAISNAFNCPALTDFKAPKNINVAVDFSKCTNLTHDSLMSIINNLTTKTSTTKLTLGTTNLAKLTDDEKAIATGKNWTLA